MLFSASEVWFYEMVSDPNISGGFSTLKREVITVKSRFISHASSQKSQTIKKLKQIQEIKGGNKMFGNLKK